MKKLLSFLAVLLFLTGCGGGGGDSSSGGGGGDIAQYVGTYTGTALVTVTVFGTTATESFPITVTIANDGTINIITNGTVASTQCSDTSPIVLSGNTYSKTITVTCTDPTLGTCTINSTENGSIANSAISGIVNMTLACSTGTYTARVTYTATKVQTAQSLSTLSTSENSIYNSVIGVIPIKP